MSSPYTIHADPPCAAVLPRAHTDENHRRRAYGRIQPMDRQRKPGAIRELLRVYREHEGRSFFADLAIVGGFLVVVTLAIVAASPPEVVNVWVAK